MHNEVLQLLTLAQVAVQQAAPEDTVVAPLLQGLYEIISGHGTTVAQTLLTLVPIALVKGDSKRQLNDVIARQEHSPSGMFIQLNRHAAFPCEVTDTGRLTLANLSLVASR